MIFDAELMFDGRVSQSGALSGTVVQGGLFAVGNTDSDNIIAVNSVKARDIGVGSPDTLLYVAPLTDLIGGAGSTIQAQLLTAPDNGFGTPGAWTVLEEGPAFQVGPRGLPAGTELLRSGMPSGVQEFLKLVYVVTGANLLSGSIVAGIVLDKPLQWAGGIATVFDTRYM